MAEAETEAPVYFAISNIPVAFRSADLRNYFSQFIESGGFHCFHYRHRPEVLRESERPENTVCGGGEEGVSKSSDTEPVPTNSSGSRPAVKSCCCVVSVRAEAADRFVRMYAGNHWIDSKGNWLARRCVIRRVRVSHDKDDDSFPYKTKYEQRHRVSLTEHFSEADLKSLPELNPPALMQNGNVGTSVKVFLQLIQSCRLPPRIIRKLGLTFPKTSSNRRYGNVPFQYQDTRTLPATEETVLTAAGHEISGPGTLFAPSSRLTQRADDDYCEEWERHEALHDDVTSQGRTKERLGRKVVVVNMDPANEGLPYSCSVDISELVTLDDVMEGLKLGPNGGLLYCMEYVEANLDWLENKLKQHSDCYFLFDCPGQVELYTHQSSVKNIFSKLEKWNFRLTAVHLVDSHYCADPAKFISVLCTSLSTMLHVELPHVNVLSKMDLIEQYGKLAFNLDFYTEVMDLSYLLDHLAADPFFKKFHHLNEKLAEVIQDYSLVSFVPLNVQDKDSMIQVLRAVDKANGYCFGDLEERNLQAMMSAAVGADFQFNFTAGVQERYMETSGKTVEEEMMDL